MKYITKSNYEVNQTKSDQDIFNQSWKIEVEKEILNEQDENQLRQLLQIKPVNLNESYNLSEQPSFQISQKNLQNIFQTPYPQSKFFQENLNQSNYGLEKSLYNQSYNKQELDILKNQSGDITDPEQLIKTVQDITDKTLLGEYLQLRAIFIDSNPMLLSQCHIYFEIIVLESGFYEGEIVNEKFHGIGGRLFPNGDIYFGQWVDGELEGEGIYKFNQHNFYKGKFEKGMNVGIGLYSLKDQSSYEGTTYNWQLTGYGKLLNPDGSIYKGKLVNGIPEGLGYEILKDGTQYEGDFVNGKRHGKGKLSQKLNQIFTLYNGEFNNGLIEGKGVMIWPNGNVYEGEWKDDLMHGQGKYTWANGQVYIGGYQKGTKSGQGSFFYLITIKGEIQFPNKKKFQGQFLNGQLHGQGILIQKQGVKEKGFWENGVIQKAQQQLIQIIQTKE